ncbi:MAG: class I SAM-dependent methyltransferase [Acidimicrobiales bacterium]
MTTTRPGHQRGLTGERPRRGATPDSLLGLHDAGYRTVAELLGPGRVLDVGCGEGFESLRFCGAGRQVMAVDYSPEATEAARRLACDGAAEPGRRVAPAPAPAFSVAQMDALALGLADRAFDAVCSSHLVEHFSNPSVHVAELARVTAAAGTAFFLTPNAPADFENPFHLRLFGPEDLGDLLRASFGDVWVGGLDAIDRVKADFAERRRRASKLLRLDVLDLRHRIPRSWYVALYTRLLPVAYALVARHGRHGPDGPDGPEGHDDPVGARADDWFVTDHVDETTLVLFAVCRRPRGAAGDGPRDDPRIGPRDDPRIGRP